MGRRQNNWTTPKTNDDRGRDRELAETRRRGSGRLCRRLFVVAAVNMLGALAVVSTAAAMAQAPVEKADAQQPEAAPAQGSAEALSVRYRFMERYSPEEDPAQPELISQYQVGIRQTSKIVREKSQGAPERLESWAQTIYTERAAKVTNLGDVIDAVRRYDKFFQKEPGHRIHKKGLLRSRLCWRVSRSGFPAARPARLFKY